MLTPDPINVRKRILFVRPRLGQGGADRVTLQLLRHIDRSRFQPELALMLMEGEFLEDVPEDVVIHHLGASSLWWTVRPLARLIQRQKYDIVYSTSTGTNVPVGLAKRLFRLGGEFVLSERSSINRVRGSRLKQRFVDFLKHRAYASCEWITSVSEGIRNQLVQQMSLPEERVRVVHNPLIDDELHRLKLEPVSHPFFDGSAPVILAAGRIDGVKNYPMLLRAFKKVLEQVDANLVILGEGPKKAKLESLAEELGIQDKVALPGFDKNPYRYMANCDVFVLTSDYEGLPGVVVQALACSAAVVATDCPTGPNELIADGKNGFLVSVNDDANTAQSILDLLQDHDLRKRFQESGPSSVARFETKQAIDSYFSFLST